MAFINTLLFDFFALTHLGVFCISRRFQRRNELIAPGRGASKETTMHLTSLHYLFLIPVGLALAFMLWVLWSLTRQLAHGNESTQKQPMISIRVGDRYSLGILPQRTPRPDVTPRASRVSDSAARPGYSASREHFQTTSAPTLGMSLRPMSSSTTPGGRN